MELLSKFYLFVLNHLKFSVTFHSSTHFFFIFFFFFFVSVDESCCPHSARSSTLFNLSNTLVGCKIIYGVPIKSKNFAFVPAVGFDLAMSNCNSLYTFRNHLFAKCKIIEVLCIAYNLGAFHFLFACQVGCI